MAIDDKNVIQKFKTLYIFLIIGIITFIEVHAHEVPTMTLKSIELLSLSLKISFVDGGVAQLVERRASNRKVAKP